MTWAVEVQKALVAKGMTQRELAVEMKCNEGQLSHILSNGNPTVKTLKRIAAAMGTRFGGRVPMIVFEGVNIVQLRHEYRCVDPGCPDPAKWEAHGPDESQAFCALHLVEWLRHLAEMLDPNVELRKQAEKRMVGCADIVRRLRSTEGGEDFADAAWLLGTLNDVTDYVGHLRGIRGD